MPAPTSSVLSSICIVRISALGDAVMVLPLIKMLRRCWPGARITWIIGRAALPLVASLAGEGVELVVIEKPRRIKDYLALRRRMKGRVFDALLCLQASFRTNLIYPCIRARRKIGYSADRAKDLHSLFVSEHIPAAPPLTHIVDGFLQFAETLGGTRDASDHAAPWGLTIAAGARAWASKILPAQPWLAVAPNATNPERNWAPESYAAAIAHAWRAHKMPAVLLGDSNKNTLKLSAQILSHLGPGIPVTNLAGQTNLSQLVAAIERCAVLLAPDTGSVHIARALDHPVIGLYAVAPATRTGPYQKTECCIDKFADAVARCTNKKDASNTPWSFRVHDPRAMQLITTAEVCAQLDHLIKTGCKRAWWELAGRAGREESQQDDFDSHQVDWRP